MGTLRFVDLQSRPTEVLDLTSLTVGEFHQLVPPFEAAFQAHMAHWRLDGRKKRWSAGARHSSKTVSMCLGDPYTPIINAPAMRWRETVGTKEYAFTVLFEPAEEGGYVVTCPALPGLVTEGDTLEEARAMAKDAIRAYLESLQKDSVSIPPDRPLREEPVKEKVKVVLETV